MENDQELTWGWQLLKTKVYFKILLTRLRSLPSGPSPTWNCSHWIEGRISWRQEKAYACNRLSSYIDQDMPSASFSFTHFRLDHNTDLKLLVLRWQHPEQRLDWIFSKMAWQCTSQPKCPPDNPIVIERNARNEFHCSIIWTRKIWYTSSYRITRAWFLVYMYFVLKCIQVFAWAVLSIMILDTPE